MSTDRSTVKCTRSRSQYGVNHSGSRIQVDPMLLALDRIVFGPAVATWLRFAPNSWRRLPIASDSPHVHGPGTNPDRILITGDGASAGRGVITHDLGLPGHLARSLSSITSRATDVDIVVTSDMTAKKCLAAIADLDLRRFDAIVLSVGAVEALAFASTRGWARDLTALLDRIERDAAPSTHTFVLSIPAFAPHRLFPPLLARACDRHVARLNRVTQSVLTDRTRARYVIVGETQSLESSGAHTYELWGASVAPHLAAELRVGIGPNPRDPVVVESERQAALDALELLELDIQRDPVLASLTARAREVFGTAYSAITLIDRHRQKIASSDGLPTFDIARSESFCNVTIQHESHLAVEDTLLDSRFMDQRMVNSGPQVRFYAGYPIESPDGHRLGTMCVLHTAPREFSATDAALLRLLAHETQTRLWELSEAFITARASTAEAEEPTGEREPTGPQSFGHGVPSPG